MSLVTSPIDHEPDLLRKTTVWFMAASVGMIVANIYYLQPLLADMATDLNLTATQVGATAMLTQVGTALGMLLFVPLGDILERRRLISTLLMMVTFALGLIATARNLLWLNIASLLVGLGGATCHIIIPFAAHLAPERERGRVVGTVLGGLLLGILLARTFSGFVGAEFGWRAVYWIAALMMAVLAVLIRKKLPPSRPSVRLRYRALMRSLIGLIRDHPALRESALIGSAFFFIFSTFWTTLVFQLGTAPLHFGARMAGVFGLVGAAGAIGAPYVGKLADGRGPRKMVGLALVVCLLSYVELVFSHGSLIALAIGALFLDMGVQAGHVSNQTRIYALNPEARSRLNTVYMVSYFTGGALGSLSGSYAWRAAGWTGMCGLSSMVLGLALLLYKFNSHHFSLHHLPTNPRPA